MFVDFMLEVFRKNQEHEAVVWKDQIFHYGWMLDRVAYWKQRIQAENISGGTVAIIEADFSPNAIALFLALIDQACILVPLTGSVEAQKEEFIEIAQGEVSFLIDEKDNVQIRKLPHAANHEIYQRLKTAGHPGLVLFSSGSTGKSKAAVHDLSAILEKFTVPGTR